MLVFVLCPGSLTVNLLLGHREMEGWPTSVCSTNNTIYPHLPFLLLRIIGNITHSQLLTDGIQKNTNGNKAMAFIAKL